MDFERQKMESDLDKQRQAQHEVVQNERSMVLEAEDVEREQRVTFFKGKLVGEEQEQQIREKAMLVKQKARAEDKIKGNRLTCSQGR